MRRFPLQLPCLFAFFVVLLCRPLPAHAQDRVALVIGNGKYIHAGALPNPANDARAVAGVLREIGFAVVSGTDLDRSGMERALFDFLDKVRAAKIALVFFAGHGLQVDGRNYLAPVDARLESTRDLAFGMIELDKVLASLDEPGRANIVILDACRDNPLARSFASKTRSGAVGAGLAAYTSLGTGTLIAFATAPDKVALDGAGANSPFTEGLIRHLRTPGLEVRQMLTRVRADVARATNDRQVPWDNSSLRGDVYLAGLPSGSGSARLLSQREQPDEAERVWALTKDTTSQSALEAFIARFPGTIFANLAHARLEEIRRVPAAMPTARVMPPGVIRQIKTEGYNGTTYIEAEFNRDPDGRWIETQKQDANARLRFVEQRQTKTEIVMYDDLRDLYLRFDLSGKRLYFRMGSSGNWVPFYKIVTVVAN